MQHLKFRIAFALTSIIVVLSLDQCVEQRLCYCQLGDGSHIDVSPVGKSRFDLIDLNGVYKYSIELCQTFNLSKDCDSVFGCQYNNESGKFNVLGRSSPTFVDKTTLKLQNGSSITYINLVCSSGVDIFRFAESFPGISPYNFTLETKSACPQNATVTTNAPNVTSTSTNSSRATSSTKTAVTTAASGTTTRSGSSSTPGDTTHTTSSPVTTGATSKTTTRNSRSTTVTFPSTTHNGKIGLLSSISVLIVSLVTSVSWLVSPL